MATRKEQRILQQIVALEAELRTTRRCRRWRCPSCKRTTAIRNLDLIQQLYYDRYASGCEGGWEHGSPGQFYIVCPKCEAPRRIFQFSNSDPNPEIEFVQEYRNYFGGLLYWYHATKWALYDSILKAVRGPVQETDHMKILPK